jgi:ectoine hydroxylase-related dioxygenase (phytanoyl-CoA dioxygenase family)
MVIGDADARPLTEPSVNSDEGMFFYDNAGWRKYPGIRKVALDSRLPELMAGLLDSNWLNFWEDTTFIKAPHTAQKTAFHQDLAYFQIEGEKCVIVWIPLDSAHSGNGVVRYVKGSHTWPDTYAPNVFFAQTPFSESPHARLPDIEAHESDYDIVSFDVEPGDVIVHHVRTIHGAGGNPTGSMRRAISFRYCGDDVTYYDRPGAIPQVGVTHALKRGDPLYALDYPLVWPRPWPGAKIADLFDLQTSGASLVRVPEAVS